MAIFDEVLDQVTSRLDIAAACGGGLIRPTSF